jgi:penicillin-binding protein 2
MGLVIFSSVFAILAATLPPAATGTDSPKNTQTKSAVSVARKQTVTAASKTAAKKTAKRPARRHYSPWTEPTFADSTIGDNIDGEDLMVRRAAVEALGPYNGSVVVVDSHTGRVLTMVNQRLTLKSGFQPCSTIKLPVAMAALIEGIIDRDTVVRVYGRKRLNLTEALAHSDNPFFATLGVKLGFERFSYYARLFGLGEKAGLNIEGEQPGVLPAAPTGGGVGMMSSFGEGISLTPLQLAAMFSSLANGGTLYYLQYPRSNEEVRDFEPRVKRRLDIEHWLPDVKPGMMAAVEYGTARRANFDPSEPVLGKTGTCTDNRTHLGWFGSFNDAGRQKLVVVVMLTGGKGVSGSAAAEIAGNTYKRLFQENFFTLKREFSPAALVSTQSCCGP